MLPCLAIVLTTQTDEMSMKGIAKDLRAIDPERLRPALNLGSLII